MSGLQQLQSYCDERARRWAVNGERASGDAKAVARGRMEEALDIGRRVAALLDKGAVE